MIVSILLVGQLQLLAQEPGVHTAVAQSVVQLRAREASVRRKAGQRLEQLGSFLWEPGAETPPPETLRKLRDLRMALGDHRAGFIDLLGANDPHVVRAAATALSIIGTDAKEAVPLLWKQLENERVAAVAQVELLVALTHVTPLDESIGAKVARHIEPYIRQNEREHQSRTETARGIRFGVPHEFRQQIDTTSHFTAQALIRAGRTSVEVSSLCRTAESHRRSLSSRALAIAVIGELGPEAPAAAERLRLLMKDDNALIRAYSALAVMRIALNQETALDAAKTLRLSMTDEKFYRILVKRFFDSRRATKDRLRSALELVVPHLLGVVAHGNAVQKRFAMRALGTIGRGAAAALPVLDAQRKSKDAATVKAAATAIRQIRNDTER